MIDEKVLRNWALELGFCQAALCSAEDFILTKEIADTQPELSERKQLKYFPRAEHPEIKSLAVLLWAYLPAAPVDHDEVFIDSYYQASNAAYHAARKLECRFAEAGHFAKANIAYPAREAAVRAGLGVIGRNSMLITREHGSRVVIILMATDIPFENNTRFDYGHCLQCGRCTRVCPSGAIDEHGMTHPERCLRNYMMEGVVVPTNVRPKMGMTLIGCDLCQRVCPMQPQEKHADIRSPFTLSDLLTDDADRFRAAADRLGEYIGRNTARPQRIRAQAALLAGNLKDPCHLSVLKRWSESPFQAVREHSLWAISQISNEQKTTPGS